MTSNYNAPFGIYIHWPFCASKCPYCDFNSHVREQINHDVWRQAFRAEINRYAAETGHLVFGTIHASTAPSCIGRILDLFPQDMHRALRSSMAFNMRGIIAQKLVPTVREDPKRVPIVEIMKMRN